MRFTVMKYARTSPPVDAPGAFLVPDMWDDFHFKTSFVLWCSDGSRQQEIGMFKIGTFGMGHGRVEVPERFEELGENYFSLGADDTFYERLAQLDGEIREAVLVSLRDVALNLELFEQALSEPVMRTSLLRGIEKATVLGQLHRIAQGGARLTVFNVSYTAPPQEVVGAGAALELKFNVVPNSLPPSNIHVLIGRNGVGKSHLLKGMASSLLNPQADADFGMKFLGKNPEGLPRRFANLVVVSFSAFDDFESSPVVQSDLTFAYVGLRAEESNAPMSREQLAGAFAQSVQECRTGPRYQRWRKALETLQTDPIFEEAGVSLLAPSEPGEEARIPERVFDRLSSGHKIVLLTVTRLVQYATERSLILIDEPESHLHPPLLSAFIRALSDLLINRNGMAVIATHSPVILQEVPRECAWVLRRYGYRQVAERPERETFGENVGVLTRDVFGLEVTRSGFHRLVSEAVANGAGYEEVVAKFGGNLGAEGRALARAAVARRDSRTGI